MVLVAKVVCFLGACFFGVLTGICLGGKVTGSANVGMALLSGGVAIAISIAYTRYFPPDRRRRSLFEVGVYASTSFLCTCVILPVLQGARGPATGPESSICASKLKQLSTSILIYGEDFDDRFPLASNWRAAAAPSTQTFRCPLAKSPWSFALNSEVAAKAKAQAKSSVKTIMLFEVESEKENVSGGEDMLVSRHRETSNVGLADGSIKVRTGSGLNYRWKL